MLFTVTPPSSGPVKVSNTNFQLHYPGVNNSMAWAEVDPIVRQVIEKRIIPFVGREMWDDIESASPTGTLAKTVELMRDAVAHYVVYDLIPTKNTIIASAGVMQNIASETTPVPQWSATMTRLSALDNADTFFDLALLEMQQLADANNIAVDPWIQSDAYKQRSVFIRSTSDLNQYVNIQMSRRSYLAIVPFCRLVETHTIKAILCGAQFDLLTASALSSPAQRLLPYVEEAVAYLAAVEALPHVRVVVDGDGFRAVSKTDGFETRSSTANNTTVIEGLIARYEASANRAVAALRGFLEANLADYPDYANSDCRQKSLPDSHRILTSCDGRVVGFF